MDTERGMTAVIFAGGDDDVDDAPAAGAGARGRGGGGGDGHCSAFLEETARVGVLPALA